MRKGIIKTINLVIVILSICIFVGCSKKAHHDKDPFEQINRGVYKVNKGLDNLYMRPVANLYRKVVPPPVRDSVGNFVQNLNEVPTFINDMLQGNPGQAGNALIRLVVNSTFGLFGFFDVAAEFGVKRHSESFDNTLVRWGYKESNYLVLPFLGPSTFRDTLGLAGNTLMSPSYYFDNNWRSKYYAMALTHKRESLLDLQEVIDAAASVDEYAFIRDAYFQKRASLLEKEGEISEADEEYLGEPPE